MKKLIPAYTLSFVISFMLFIYEPITMYANNINDFWFDFRIMFIPMITTFSILFISISIIFTLIYYANKIISEKLYVYNIILIIAYIIFFILYIQGNYLISKLPPLDGTNIDWSIYKTQNIITLIITLIIIITYIITTLKFKHEKVINISKYITLTIFGMLSVSLISTMLTTDLFKHKNIYTVTSENYNTASTDKNLFIFLVDAVDSKKFSNVLEKSKYKNAFEDFTYYPDTLAGYTFTRDSIPLILTGIWNDNKEEFSEYYNNAMENSKFINEIIKQQYKVNMYETEWYWTTEKSEYISNIKKVDTKLSLKDYAKQEIKYTLFKYLPYKLKKYSKIESLDFKKITKNNNIEQYHWDNITNYEMIKNNIITKESDKIIDFIHIEGGHVPLNLDENLNIIQKGTYEQKIAATIKVINKFVTRLKENDVYDNSAIVILADHGYNGDDKIEGRQNPILYIKGINEHHKMNISDKPVSYEDLSNSYLELLDGKKSTELFKDIPNKRPRRYLLYSYTRENHMVEYEQNGKAWDLETLKKTGREFNR